MKNRIMGRTVFRQMRLDGISQSRCLTSPQMKPYNKQLMLSAILITIRKTNQWPLREYEY